MGKKKRVAVWLKFLKYSNFMIINLNSLRVFFDLYILNFESRNIRKCFMIKNEYGRFEKESYKEFIDFMPIFLERKKAFCTCYNKIKAIKTVSKFLSSKFYNLNPIIFSVRQDLFKHISNRLIITLPFIEVRNIKQISY